MVFNKEAGWKSMYSSPKHVYNKCEKEKTVGEKR